MRVQRKIYLYYLVLQCRRYMLTTPRIQQSTNKSQHVTSLQFQKLLSRGVKCFKYTPHQLQNFLFNFMWKFFGRPRWTVLEQSYTTSSRSETITLRSVQQHLITWVIKQLTATSTVLLETATVAEVVKNVCLCNLNVHHIWSTPSHTTSLRRTLISYFYWSLFPMWPLHFWVSYLHFMCRNNI
jgi:hypothetical protein